jgi:hypothetical protein
MGWWVSARQRVRAPELVAAMQHNYFGNVTLYALGDVAVEEILRKPLAEVAAMARDTITSLDYDQYIQEMVDWVEVHKTEGLMEARSRSTRTLAAAKPRWQCPSLTPGGSAPLTCRLALGRAAGDGSLVSAYIWPQLAAALEGDGIFKPVTAEYISVSPRMTSDCETEEARAMPSGCLIFMGVPRGTCTTK